MYNSTPAAVIVPDTSVVLKWYLHRQEPQRDKALSLLAAYLEGHLLLVILDLLVYEMTNVLRYKPDWDTVRVQQAIDSFFALGLEIMTPSASSLKRAVEIAYSYDITVYDACFIAISEQNKALFVTADMELISKIGEFPFVQSLGLATFVF